MRRLVFYAEAERDLENIADFLERESPGLELRFAKDVAGVTELALSHPGSGVEVAPGVRRLLIARFRCAVYYEVHADRVAVLAVTHQRRDPDHWRTRI